MATNKEYEATAYACTGLGALILLLYYTHPMTHNKADPTPPTPPIKVN